MCIHVIMPCPICNIEGCVHAHGLLGLMCSTILEQAATIDADAALEARRQLEGTLPYEPLDTPQLMPPMSISPVPHEHPLHRGESGSVPPPPGHHTRKFKPGQDYSDSDEDEDSGSDSDSDSDEDVETQKLAQKGPMPCIPPIAAAFDPYVAGHASGVPTRKNSGAAVPRAGARADPYDPDPFRFAGYTCGFSKENCP